MSLETSGLLELYSDEEYKNKVILLFNLLENFRINNPIITLYGASFVGSKFNVKFVLFDYKIYEETIEAINNLKQEYTNHSLDTLVDVELIDKNFNNIFLYETYINILK